MPAPKIVFPCDHIILEKVTRSVSTAIVRGQTNTNHDVLSNYTVESIKSVTSIDGKTRYYEEVDYKRYLHNKILWIKNSVAQGDSYLVEFEYSISQEVPYEPEDCPRCGGIGWYVDMINLNTGRMERVQGIEKIAQDIIKALLTEIGSDKRDKKYGTIIRKMPGSTLKENIMSSLRVIVHDVETVYRDRQSKSRGKIPDSEMLDHLNLLDIDYLNDQQTRILLSIEIVSYTNESVVTNLAIGG